MSIRYSLVETEGDSNITVFVDGKMYVATSENPNWREILEAVRGRSFVTDWDSLFDPATKAQREFKRVTERVSVAGGVVYFDGDPIDNALTRQILRFMEEGLEFKPLVNFFERMAQNPEQHSREQLYAWLNRHKFAITDEGNIVMYKGVRKNADGSFVSIMSGPGIVDGKEMSGNLPNAVGSVIEISRSKVQHNPGIGCASGLHAGTYEYASGFAQGALLTVEVNPRDVVSVPTDCDAQKVRVSRYVVKEVTPHKYEGALVTWGGSNHYDNGRSVDECPDCGETGDFSTTEGYCGLCY